jgi:excisionase family DNA binding protein
VRTETKRVLSEAGLLTTTEVARLLNVHPNTVRHWTDAQLLPAYRIGPRRDRRFRRADVDAFLGASLSADDRH